MLNLRQILSILSIVVMYWIDYSLARGGRKGGRSSGRGGRMKKKLCCGGLAGVDSSAKKMPDWMIAILVFLVVIALYMMYVLIRWIYVKRLQGRLFTYRPGIDQRGEASDATTVELNSPTYVFKRTSLKLII